MVQSALANRLKIPQHLEKTSVYESLVRPYLTLVSEKVPMSVVSICFSHWH